MIPALDLGASREVRIRGSLKKKRKEAIDEGFVKASLDFIEGANLEKKPFFVWFTPTRMHIWAHLRPESQARISGKTGLGIFPDGWSSTTDRSVAS
jgi:hypothetical protein